ncbi:MAG: signal peptidase II [Deltaproteobacteria bacterium]|nr:signal peptidase II [Deltaproteobacteria bacterium]
MSAKVRLFVLVIIASLALDFGTKVAVRRTLAPDASAKQAYRTTYRPGLDPWCQLSQRQIRVVEGFFDICYSENTGVAFGLGKKVPWGVWVGVGVLALGLILTFLRQARDDQRLLVFSLALVGSGAIGNIADRARFGYVTDFVVWRWHEHTWPTFNVADAALVVGVILMFLTMGKKRDEAGEDEKAERGGDSPRAKRGRRKAR